jgi:tetratricopeptide (TPR) repeat protein
MHTHTRTTRYIALVLVACMGGLLPGTARADTSDGPWHRGVSQERKQMAQALFTQGGDMLERLMLREARAKYEAALSHWEHPQIRFYLATVLYRLGQPLDAYESLRQAVSWGAEALEPEEEQEAQRLMRALLETDLAAIAVRCDEPGAQVTLNGKPWFVGPGAERRLLLPGEHVITAEKRGYFPVVEAVTVLAGRQASLTLALSVDEIRFRHRWSTWQPWAVVAAGALAGLASTGLRAEARIHFEAAEQEFHDQCRGALKCQVARSSLLDRARREDRLALGALATGGVIAASGLIMAWLNRPQPYRTKAGDGADFELVPLDVDGTAGVSARLSF